MSEWSIPDAIEEVVGYRVWDLTESGRLRSTNSGFGCWEPGDNEAVCQRSPRMVRKNGPDGLLYVPVEDGHTAIPDAGCECGFWLLKDLHAARDKFDPRPAPGVYRFTMTYPGTPAPEPSVGKVIGEVKGWGRVVVGQDGWRVEKARISALLTSNKSGYLKGDQLAEVSERYVVPVVEAPELNAQRTSPSGWVTFAGGSYRYQIAGNVFASSLMDAIDQDDEEPLTPVERTKKAKQHRTQSLEQMRRRDRRRS